MAGQGIKMTHDDFMHLGNGELKDCLSLRGMITSGNIYKNKYHAKSTKPT